MLLDMNNRLARDNKAFRFRLCLPVGMESFWKAIRGKILDKTLGLLRKRGNKVFGKKISSIRMLVSGRLLLLSAVSFLVTAGIGIFSFKYFLAVRGFWRESNSSKIMQNDKLLGEKQKLLTAEKSLFLDPLELILWFKEKKENFLLVDIRGEEAYQKGHLLSAVRFKSLESFKKLPTEGRLLVLYGNFGGEMTTRKVALDLLKEGYDLKILTIGFNEFRHLKAFWVPRDEWDSLTIEELVEGEE